MNIYIIISGTISILLIIISYIINRRNTKDSKILRYECGEEEYKDTNLYTLMYYKIAVTYLVFDIETILLFPTALITYTPIEYRIYIIIYTFIIIILIGLYIEYYNNIYY